MNNSRVVYTRMPSPLGRLLLLAEDEGLIGLYTESHRDKPSPLSTWREDPGWFSTITSQIEEYFTGTRTAFDLPLAARGTPFQREVWRLLSTLPLGHTTTYQAIAEAMGKPKAARAVGAANGQNPLSIIVPCHRVVGADGALVGYAGGLQQKRWLLDHERKVKGSIRDDVPVTSMGELSAITSPAL